MQDMAETADVSTHISAYVSSYATVTCLLYLLPYMYMVHLVNVKLECTYHRLVGI